MLVDQEIVVVTGAASGIGFAISQRLANARGQIVMLDIDEKALKAAVKKLNNSAIGFHCDVSDEMGVNETIKEINEKYGKISILVNNAGISINKTLEATSLQDWNKVIGTNLTSIFIMTKAFVKQLTSANPGLVINIASVSGMVGMPNYLAYNVSKAGVIELTKTLALELAPNIRVNAICPGYILTPMQEREYTPEEIEQCAQSNPLKRLGQPNEIAAMVEYLMSKDAKYINGSILVIDGGETAGGLASL